MQIEINDDVAVFPALAGMNPGQVLVEAVKERVPRARGDEPRWGNPAGVPRACSPRSRG